MSLQETIVISWPPELGPTGTASALGAGTQINASTEYAGIVVRAYKAMTITTIAFYVQAVTTPGTVDARVETVAAGSKFPSGSLFGTTTNIVSGTISAAGWNTLTLTLPANINLAEIFAVIIKSVTGDITIGRIANFGPGQTLQTGGYHVVNTGVDATSSNMPCIAAGDGTSYYFLGQAVPAKGVVVNTFGSTTTAGSGGDERGIRFKLPFKATIVGMTIGFGAAIGSDFDILVTDDAGNELNSSATAINRLQIFGVNFSNALMFDNSVDVAANTWTRVFVRPTTASTLAILSLDLNSAELKTALCGTLNFQHTFRTDGGTPDDSNTTDYPMIGLLLLKFDDGAGGGGYRYHPGMSGLLNA